jgi:tetratricopeptide (TPR) repeat protein
MAALVACAGCLVERVDNPAERLKAGWERFAQGDHSLALAEFDTVFKSLPPDSPLRAETLYGLATTWNMRRPQENPALAAQYYKMAIETAPGSDWDAWSRLALVRMPLLAPGAAVHPPDPAVMRQAYQEVIDRFPVHEAGEQAFLFQQAILLETADPGQARVALSALEGFLQTHPKSPYVSAVWRLIGHACSLLDQPERVLEAVMQEWKTTEIDPLNPGQELAGLYWRVGTLAEFETGDFATARFYYRKMIEDYPTDMRVILAKQELTRMDELEARLRAEAGPGGAP